jgi:protein-S-isoprenylcysteine O-methyltransferase Ste14
VPAGPIARALEAKIPAPIVAIVAGSAMKAYRMGFGVGIDPTPFRMYVGLALAAASAVMALAAMLTFWRVRTTINPLDPSQAARLVTSGMFRFSRNPMYVSLLVLLAAYAVRIDSLAIWLAPALFVAYVTRFQIVPEERALEAKFGDEYRRYRMRTRRWL